MKKRPIIFSALMVRALLDGSKTQTRRVCKLEVRAGMPNSEWESLHACCPYGQPGDRLWVREAFRTTPRNDLTKPSNLPVASSGNTLAVPFWYDADIDGKRLTLIPSNLRPGKYRPGMFMPRAASRITLQITDVRVERLQDISRGDAMAEGCPYPNMKQGDDPRKWYADLWESINGECSWDLDPWVWVIGFRVVKA